MQPDLLKTYMNAPPICDMCGLNFPSNATVCAYCGGIFDMQECAKTGAASLSKRCRDEFDYRIAKIESEIFKEAEALYLLNLFVGKSASDLGYERELVLENEDTFYFPLGGIGCGGNLVSKSPLRLISFGSYIAPSAHIWAYYQGISMAPLGKDRQNSLKILHMKDEKNTVRVLKTFLNPRWVERELVPKLTTLPVEINGIDLYFGIRGLLEAIENEWFSFQVSN
ncbi:hypothetical protein CLU94_5136 [Janthinobacterium sp. 13]|nr:hypothetical protein CLU94_5136 [Janthinobacterium sp. 13]